VASLTILVDPLPLDPPVIVAINEATVGSGYDTVTISKTCSPDNGGLPTADPLLQSSLLRLCR
jgi:hypothetical protein